ncbi:glycosyl transferase family 1 [Komagataeibacter saccharivorans]|uniref:glycosyltransferase family 4 protein n=1 Tax=Komagataeibacter saccharivorans TaxID=265959 RepID=UPI000D7C5185|nr:glycosyltransferase family 1 protein [Komagataeibacter saccharivorans]PYD50276.1 glycosyl transferase family 1 [Komagataeibacter saccharivorans]GBQ39868.1 glycosyltransferase [Komagataeibacter saccharivorans NRIC 0614]
MVLRDPGSTSPLRIWLDSRNTGRPGGTGVATYTTGMRQCFTQMGCDVTYLWDRAPDATAPPPNTPARKVLRFMHALLPFPTRVRRRQRPDTGERCWFVPDLFRLANVHFRIWKRPLRLCGGQPPAIMYSTYPLPFLVDDAINVVTIHDLIPLTHPELTGIDRTFMEKLLRRQVALADVVVTVSETVRQQIVDMFHVPADRIFNLYQPVSITDVERRAMEATPAIAPAGCFLFIGRVEARKNIERLVAAHALSGTARPLVIMGPDGDDQPDFTPRTPRQQIIRIPWCSRESLLRTLRDAHALLFPSLAEGFGLPIIEAMALGVPVLTSRGGATGEIAGDAALLVDPLDTGDITQGIAALDRMTADTAQWQQMVARGHSQAERFSPAAQIERMTPFLAHLSRLSATGR